MTSRENRSRVDAEIPIETKQALKNADEPIWKLLDEGARIVLGLDEGSTEAAIEQRLSEVRQERREISDQLDNLQNRVDDLDDMESDLEANLEDIRQKKESHKERLDQVLDEMESDAQDRPVVAWMSDLREASTQEYGSTSKENIRRVVEDLRERSVEQNRAIVPSRLTRSANAGSTSQPVADGGSDSSDLRILGDSDD